MDRQGKEFKYPLAHARGSVVLPNPKIVPKNKKFQRSTMKQQSYIQSIHGVSPRILRASAVKAFAAVPRRVIHGLRFE
jgi:hypothetical protein